MPNAPHSRHVDVDAVESRITIEAERDADGNKVCGVGRGARE